MQQTGRLQSHHAPRATRQNFTRNKTDKDLNKVDPNYIVDYEDHPSKLEEREAKEREEKRRIREQKIKKICAWSCVALAIILLLLLIILLSLYFATCYLGNCPPGCYDCQFAPKDWKKSRSSNRFTANHRYCGSKPLSVNFTENLLTVDSSMSIGRSRGLSTPSPLIHAYTALDQGVMTRKLNLYWYTTESVRNNETLRLVFSDNGDQYAGAGNFGEQMIRNKPTDDKTYTWWSSHDDPIYFPYYLTRNENASICMFLEGDGVPVEITVKKTVTEWLVYKTDLFQFHVFSGATPYEALGKCTAKWHELHPIPDVFWTDQFILGSFTTSQVVQAQNTAGILATHYLLSPDTVSLTSSGVTVKDSDTLSNYGNVYYTWAAKQKITAGSGISTEPENGYYAVLERNETHLFLESDAFYLDYTSDNVRTLMTEVTKADTQGFLLKDGFLPQPTAECRRDHLQCSLLDFSKESNMCLDTEFSGGMVLDTHNLYDRSRAVALRSAQKTVFESVASPGTTFFHRDLKLTPEGLRTCFNNIINLQAIGVRAVTCNMCGGLIPGETNADESYSCDKWSMLSVLMPYIIMTNDASPPFISESVDAGRYVNNNLKVRKEFKYEINAAFRSAIADSKPFAFPVSAIHSDNIYTDSDGIMIGERLYFRVDLEPAASGDLTVALPPGAWYSNGGPQRGQHYPGGREISQSSRSFSDLFFFKVGHIFVMGDPEPSRENHVIVRIFKYYDERGDVLTDDFVHYEPGSSTPITTTIEFDPIEKEISFTYKSTGQNVAQDLSISKIEVYLWHLPIANQPDWVSFEQTADKYDVTIDYVAKNDVKSIFESWVQDSTVFGT